MDIKNSILGLVNKNNGIFKSEPQANFLTKELESGFGYVGVSDSGYNSCPIFAKWDDKGIVELCKDSKSGRVIIFQRKVGGILNDIDTRNLKLYKKNLVKLERKLKEKVLSYQNGTYNGTGDINTYSEIMIKRYLEVKGDLEEQISSLKSRIKVIEAS